MTKSSKTKSEKQPIFLSNKDGMTDSLSSWVGGRFDGRSYCIVYVHNKAEPNINSGEFDLSKSTKFDRALIVMEELPIDIDLITRWRKWAMKLDLRELRMAFMEKEADEESFLKLLDEHCGGWDDELPEPEIPAIRRGSFVKMPDGHTAKDDSSLLTMMFGSMGELLTRIEVAGRRFKRACTKGGVTKESIKKYIEEIDKQLADKSRKETEEPKLPDIEGSSDHFPKLLLFGESGVGKTLIASYLQLRTGLVEGRPRRIPIPEYLGKEEMLEYDLFGYAKGAYTGGREAGDHGLLLGHTGGVIFLDEIGEANEIIQAKLLAFLDDYRVRPRGWVGKSFYCPVLIMAATNKDLQKMVKEGSFRKDLLARFTDHLTAPPLRERMEDIQFILDCLLQRESLNPDLRVEEIGEGALEVIKARDFKDGNFRELEDLFRVACHRAARDGRNYLVKSDFE